MRSLRFFRALHAENGRRVRRRRALAMDLLRLAANRALVPAERRLARAHRDPGQPLVFIVGCPRSGTTLLHQLCARWLDVGYVSNRVARWWLAPVWASRRAGRARPAQTPLRSELGAAEGEDAPHEFGWFWQYHLELEHSDALTAAELDRIDWGAVALELEGLAGWWALPLVLKNLNHTAYHATWLARRFPQARFVCLRRDPRYCAQSILEARVKRYGDERTWWSIRPRDVRDWLDRPPVEQVCHQVRDVNRALDRAGEEIEPARWHEIDYETVIGDPVAALEALARFCGTRLREAPGLAQLSLKSASARRCDPERFAQLDDLLG